MAYQYVREPLTTEDADKLANACEHVREKLIVWPLIDCGLRVSELCNLKRENVQLQQRWLRIKGKGGPYGKRSKVRVVPMSPRVRAIFEPYFALHEQFPVKPPASSEGRERGRQPCPGGSIRYASYSQTHVCDDVPAEGRVVGGSEKDPRPRSPIDYGDLPEPD